MSCRGARTGCRLEVVDTAGNLRYGPLRGGRLGLDSTLIKLLHAYDGGDGLHWNPAGYQAMANAVELQRFSR